MTERANTEAKPSAAGLLRRGKTQERIRSFCQKAETEWSEFVLTREACSIIHRLGQLHGQEHLAEADAAAAAVPGDADVGVLAAGIGREQVQGAGVMRLS